MDPAGRRNSLEFFNKIKRILETHHRVAKLYLSSFTLLAVCCITLGLVAFAVPGRTSGAAPKNPNGSLVEINTGDKDDNTSPVPTEAEAPTMPVPTGDQGDKDPSDDEEGVTETHTESGAKSGNKDGKTPTEATPSEGGEDDPEEVQNPTKEPDVTATPAVTPEATATPEPTPVRSLKWKDIPEQVDFGVTYIEDNTMIKGQSRVVSEGEYGIKTTVWEITLVDGVEESRKIVAIKDTKAPVNKVVALGTIDSFVDSKGRVTGLSSKIVGDATAYGNSVKWGNQIYYGSQLGGLTTRWGVIAVDPEVIPLGTKVYVKGLNGVNDYGYAIAGDIGGAIKGTRIDLWMDNREIIKIWGIRDVEIYILADQTVDVFELRGDDKWIPPAKYNYVDPETN